MKFLNEKWQRISLKSKQVQETDAIREINDSAQETLIQNFFRFFMLSRFYPIEDQNFYFGRQLGPKPSPHLKFEMNDPKINSINEVYVVHY